MAAERPLTYLWRIGGDSWNGTVAALSADGDANVYLLKGRDGTALIDCGTLNGRAVIESNLREIGAEPGAVSDLLLTHSHWDHTEAAHGWQEAYELRTHLNAIGASCLKRGDYRLVGSPLHGPDYLFMPFRVDHAVEHQETFDLVGIRVKAHHFPGHTPDSTLFVCDIDGLHVGICGDVAFGPTAEGTHSIGLMSNLWQSDLDRYLETLEAMSHMVIDVLVPGHGTVVAGREAVRASIAATQATAQALASNPAVRANLGVCRTVPRG